MSEEQRLLQAIYDNPDADEPRLVFADWLEENGDPEWAEFIRVDCEWRRADPDVHPIEHSDLEKRRDSLIRKHKKKWNASKPQLGWRGLWDRGFFTLEGAPNTFKRDEADNWWEEHQNRVAKIALVGKFIETGWCDQLPQSVVAKVTEIRRKGGRGFRQVELEEIAKYTNLQVLEYEHGGMQNEVQFAPLAALPRLHTLQHSGRGFDVATVESLHQLPALRKLSLDRHTQEEMQALCALSDLEELVVGTVYGPEENFHAEHLQALERLRHLNVGSLLRWSEFPALPELRELDWHFLGPEVAGLANSPQLEKLAIRGIILEFVLEALPALPNLRTLELEGLWTGEGIAWEQLPNLQTLTFPGGRLEPDYIDAWPEVPSVNRLRFKLPALPPPEELEYERELFAGVVERFPNLEVLHMDSLEFLPELVQLKQLRHVSCVARKEDRIEQFELPSVESFHLRWKMFGRYLLTKAKQLLPKLPALKFLKIDPGFSSSSEKITQKDIKTLRESWPDVTIVH